MKLPEIRRTRPADSTRNNERGVTMVLVAISMVAIIAIAAWSIDLVTLYLAREEAQRAADSAAVAAARVISLSGITGTADPSSNPAAWSLICGGSGSAATQVAQVVAAQNAINNAAGTVTVTYSAGNRGPVGDCSTLLAPAAVNPMVTVKVQRAGLPSFFSRIWGYTGNSVSATAMAEAFNPSASDTSNNGGSGGVVVPVQPRCVKPWMVPNQDPGYSGANGVPPVPFVAITNGQIRNPGISLNGTSGSGVIGETFNLYPDCTVSSACPLASWNDTPPVANSSKIIASPGGKPTLEYLPGSVIMGSSAVPACGTVGAGGNLNYEPAVAGCDQATAYQCGVQASIAPTPNSIDLNENPASSGDTANGISCLINQTAPGSVSGQDTLDTTAYPFKITAGSSNPLGSIGNISSSNSIVSFPIYDTSVPLTITGTTANVTILGFVQAFVNQVNTDGSLQVTVLNISGCGNNAPAQAINGTSPVPIRLITPP